MKKKEKKDSNVSGEILLQFSLSDSANPSASPAETYRKFKTLVSAGEEDEQSPDDQPPQLDLDELDQETSDETDDPSKPDVVEKRRRRLRLARLRRKSLAARAYQFSGSGTGVQGIVFIEIVRVRDLPPERNGKIVSALFFIHLTSQWEPVIDLFLPSNSHVIRHGPLCCDFSRTEDPPHACHQAQFEPGVS